jgi:hypothetical protein
MTTIPLVHFEPRDEAVACTLTPGEYKDRTTDLSDLAARALISRAPIDGGQRLTFIDIPAVERELRAAVAAEASCCSFLSMSLTRTCEALVLDITGPEQAQPVIAELFA